MNSKRNIHTDQAITDTTDNNTKETLLILCIGNNLYTKKPVFNEQAKTLHIFANRTILLKAKEQVVIQTDETFYLSNYVHNYWTINAKYMGINLTIDVDRLNERTINQKLKITFKNYSIFTYRISAGDEIGELTFVTDKKINYQLMNTSEIDFNTSDKKIIIKNNDNN